MAPVQQAASSLWESFFQDLVVNVSALGSCVWSQGLSGKSERVHVWANSNTQVIWDVVLGFCSARQDPPLGLVFSGGVADVVPEVEERTFRFALCLLISSLQRS